MIKLLFAWIASCCLFFNAVGQQSAGRLENRNETAGLYKELDPFKIVYFGSSVPFGQGAFNRAGYTFIYTQILNARSGSSGNSWKMANISVPGDNTVKVLNRYSKDLLPQKAKYVVFALSLGNEGIHEKGQAAFEQFKTNLKKLIDKARADGMVPVVTNCYTRNDFTAADYSYIKQMNLLIHSWDVPSVNLLGAVDDLAGHWTDGYWDDAFHPNDSGHAEMAYTIVPSLFDALHTGKPLPRKVSGSSVTFRKKIGKSKAISFTPENIVHPFTAAFSFKTNKSGTLLKIKGAGGIGTVSIKNGVLTYTSAKGGSITGVTPVNDNKWHKAILTHYYAAGKTFLYCDSTVQGNVQEKLIAANLKIGGNNIPKKVEFKDLLFYRSAMNADEAKYIARDSLLKSSLELYAPLDGRKVTLKTPLINLAQSTNKLKLDDEAKSE